MATRVTRRIGSRPRAAGVGFRLHEIGDGDGPTIVVLGGTTATRARGCGRR